MLAAWLKRRPEPPSVKKLLSDMFDQYVASTLSFVRRNLKYPVPSEDTTLVSALLKNLDVRGVCARLLVPCSFMLAPLINQALIAVSNSTPSNLKAVLSARGASDKPLDAVEQRCVETMVVFSLIWAFGSCLTELDGEVGAFYVPQRGVAVNCECFSGLPQEIL
jgi:hypothetical protein